MRLSTKGRYAVTAMMDLAMRDNGHPVSLAEISQTQGISNSYLEQLFRKLSQNNLVYGTRGHGVVIALAGRLRKLMSARSLPPLMKKLIAAIAGAMVTATAVIPA